MTRPVRLQLSRRKGFDLQSWSRQVNGLEAVKCTRPRELGNPFRAGGWFRLHHGRGPFSLIYSECLSDKPEHRAGYMQIKTAAEAVEWYRKLRSNYPLADNLLNSIGNKNLACYCHLCPKHAATGKPLDEHCPDCAPCHVDVLGDIICEVVG